VLILLQVPILEGGILKRKIMEELSDSYMVLLSFGIAK